MRNSIVGLVMTVGLLSASAGLTATAQPANPPTGCGGGILANPSLESGTTPPSGGWKVTGGQLTAQGGYQVDGSKYGWVAPSQSGTTATAYQDQPGTAGAVYTLTFWGGTHAPNFTHTTGVRFLGSGGSVLLEKVQQVDHDVDVDNKLQRYDFEPLTAPAGTTTVRFFATANGDYNKFDCTWLREKKPDVGKVGDFVWVDQDRDGQQDAGEPGVEGVKATLKKPDGSTATATTDANGKYLFDKLPNGAYTVCFDLNALPAQYADFKATTANSGNDATDSDAGADGCTASTTLGPNKQEDLTLDAGIAPPLNKLGDFVWIDQNRDGLQDVGEPAVAGVTVLVQKPDGSSAGASVTTGSDGKYLFATLPDGDFRVCFDKATLPAAVADYQLTKPNAGDDGKDSDADPASGCTEPVALGPGKRENLTLDAGLVSPLNRLGDFVWIDVNRNGLQDATEAGVEGVTATLSDGKTTKTDKDGKYLFDGLPDGAYSVCFKDFPAEYTLTVSNVAGGDDAKDSDADQTTGCTQTTTLGAGNREGLTLDAGLVGPLNKLGDFVWVDVNRNGSQDATEAGVEGVTVTLSDGKTTKTDKDGKYLFADLPDGQYTVCFDLKALPGQFADYQVTKPNAGDDGTDSDADPATGCTEPVELGLGKRENLTLDLGIISPVNRLGDYVWVDTNRNGLQDTAELGVEGVTVTLSDGKTTKTDKDGKYLFDGLPDGMYSVCFKDFPADYVLTVSNVAGGDDAKDSDADAATGCTQTTTLGVGKREDLTLDAGLVSPLNKLGDYVWVDTNKNGQQDDGESPVAGVAVTLSDGKKTMTDKDGKYLFGDLPDGTYTVCFAIKALPAQYTDFQVTKPNTGDDGKDSDADPATGCTEPVELGLGKRENLTLDLGIVSPVNRLGDYVWVDTNKNGQQDTGEPGVEGVTVTLPDGKTTKTDKDGKYLFEDVPDGQYKVCFDIKALPAAYADSVLTKPDVGADGTDSDAAADGCTPAVTLGPGSRENLTLDAGLVSPPNKLGDYVWVDANRNGAQDPSEPGVPDVTVTLSDGKKTTTDKDGNYLFDNLPDGTYKVCFDLKALPANYADYLVTKANAGADAADSDAGADGCTEPTTLGVGKREDLTLDAGIRPPNNLGDLVWVDTDRDGTRDPGEPGVPGVTVTLIHNDKPAGTTKTDENGLYKFDNLTDGHWVVCFDKATLPAKYADYQLTKGADSKADQATWCTPPASLYASTPEDLTLDAGIVEPRNRIGDYVWIDKNGNGLQDPGEPVAPNVALFLRDKDGKEIAKSTTDKDGKYLFDSLPDGTYSVCLKVAELRGYTLTKVDSGDDTKDSDFDPASGCSKPVAVGPGKRENLTIDAGVVWPAPPAQPRPIQDDSSLASTGVTVLGLAGLGILVVALGVLLTVKARKRRT